MELHEVRVMKIYYRPRLFLERSAATTTRHQTVRVLSPGPGVDGWNGRGCDFTAKDIFCDAVKIEKYS